MPIVFFCKKKTAVGKNPTAVFFGGLNVLVNYNFSSE